MEEVTAKFPILYFKKLSIFFNIFYLCTYTYVLYGILSLQKVLISLESIYQVEKTNRKP